MSGGPFNGKAVLTGAGKSQVGRRLGRTGLDLTLEAVLRAISDAGLTSMTSTGSPVTPGRACPTGGFPARPSRRSAMRWDCGPAGLSRRRRPRAKSAR